MVRILAFFWSQKWVRLAVAATVAGFAGLVSAWLMPRGPVTASDALISMVAALLLGAAACLIMGSRWSMLVAPVAFFSLFELGRMGISGPTVDQIHFGSTYGVIAFVVGRFTHALLVIGPMLLGAGYGGWIAGRLSSTVLAKTGVFGWVVTLGLTAAYLALAFVISRPAETLPILGPDGESLAGSIAEIIEVPIGGHDQTIMIRGRNAENPVLLYLAGGPGGTDLGAMRADVSMEEHFTIATWEQRGVGKSYTALDPVGTLTLGQMVNDAVEVANYLRERFDEEKIYLAGNSWGTLLGALTAQRQPELFHAFISTGQMVSPRETDRMFYEDTLNWAEKVGSEKLVASLIKNGPPPYADLLMYEPAISHEHDWNPYPDLDVSKEMPNNLFVHENSFMDRINGLRSFLDTFSVLYPQIQDLDLRQDVPGLEIPVFVVLGKYEARGRAVLAKEWFEALNAPVKELVIFEHSGHRPHFEEPGEFSTLMERIRENTFEGS